MPDTNKRAVVKIPSGAFLTDVATGTKIMELLSDAVQLDTCYDNGVGYKIVGKTSNYSRTSLELVTTVDVSIMELSADDVG